MELRFILGSGSPIPRGGVQIRKLFLDEIRETLDQLEVVLQIAKGGLHLGGVRAHRGWAGYIHGSHGHLLGLAVVRPRSDAWRAGRGRLIFKRG